METLSLKNMLDEIFAGLLSFTEDAGADCASAQLDIWNKLST